ncbi:hypothetical protein QFC22_004464 [Naganishia vaughanmartiniae]|uniref:Uncharacterized protein n=1 Tax=Naganishia vaughanmartiniae TaxID=1424756 RepID=A0ACC2X2Q4_9TREE|nr:hypothetical protein QFC22_004464 [Naganishia vaughanmartiniae]
MMYSYSSAPNTGETVVLDCSNTWTTTDANEKWIVVGDGGGPEVAWHTMDLLGERVLVFGGDGGVTMPIQTRNDSTWLINLASSTPITSANSSTMSYGQQTTSDQPIRKIYSATSASPDHQTIYPTGGEKADGSGLGYKETWSVTISSQQIVTYKELPPLPTDLVHHQSILLSNGTLLLLGGYIPSTSSFLPMSEAYMLDTSDTQDALWRTVAFHTSSQPAARRGHTASLIAAQDGTEQILLIGGTSSSNPSASASGQGEVLEDIWILDPARGEWREISGNEQVNTGKRQEGPGKRETRDVLGKRGEVAGPGARYDHIAQVIGGQIVVFGGKFSPSLSLGHCIFSATYAAKY